MNIYDISKQAGVSIATVSRVLNGSDKVSPSTREKVLQVIEQNSYTPNAFARSLGLNSMHTVGILCADSSDVYLASAIYYLERELRQNSYASMLCCTIIWRKRKNTCSFCFQGMWMPCFLQAPISWRIRKKIMLIFLKPLERFLFSS